MKEYINLERPFEISNFEWAQIVKKRIDEYIKSYPGFMLVTGVRCGQIGKNGGSCMKLKNHTGMHETN